jgi:hypothetical protein
MIYEFRIYHCAPGRLPALNKRFESVTLSIWKKHGIEQAGFWTTLIGNSNQTLTYILKWKDMAEREEKWNAFSADPEWITERTLSEADGILIERIENMLLTPTAYSAMK